MSSDQTLLINILNTMYNDNLQQIRNFTSSINALNNSNSQIRNLMFQTLNRQNASRQTSRTTTNAERTRLLPYQLESITRLQNFLQPIEIYPQQSQIESATRRVRYCDIVSPMNISCPISLENFNDNEMVSVIRHCGHIFRTDSLNTWFTSHCNCPVCRYDIRNYNATPSDIYQTSTNLNRIPTINNSTNERNIEENNNTLQNSTQRPTYDNLHLLNTIFDTSINSFLENYGNGSDYQVTANRFLLDASNNLLHETVSNPDDIYNLFNTSFYRF